MYWNRDKPDSFKKHYDVITMSYYNEDSVFYSKADIARSYARRAYVQYNYKGVKPSQIILDVESALKFDSLQKEAIYLWGVALKEDYTLSTKREPALKLIEKGITKFSTDKKYVSELYNVKAILLDTKKDTAGVEKALNESVRIYPDNISAWQNLFTFCNAAGRQEKGVAATEKLIPILQKKGDSKTLANALVYKGDFLWRLNKKDDAKKLYNEALIWDADNATAKERVKM
jgi:tetratricopeptide (TPR) repeat protein